MMTASIINRARGKTKRAAFKIAIQMAIAPMARSIIKRLDHQVDRRFNHFNQFDDANERLSGAMNAYTGFND